ncbi:MULTISPECIES: DNA repair protein RecO [Pseudonocardia]|uniref:DNA repair protein RecO n=2 Tax=Pseudonocardia TaxID=1847 RepID=A0A1Y2MWW6_PSEAH|nr:MULTISPECIES: DNA repair protein RecO [Pseudonocardia]OSY39611.1 DNA repair protein RecO [Pseudonocardia autotrophica]TDN72742.1 DNA replication and repair protein RecO [Pseudonocardia autotrophica]BBG03457.1 DNA repair protein RecO [Pseudonocardia autotrophica]GEC24877.1 DNA repair protein RecO [Pseudonocardia saturnea]
MAQLYRDTGIVLRVQKLGEADRIVTMLTRQRGKIRVVAKGVRRTRSRWGARLEPFNHVDVQCYTGRTLDVVTQAQTLDAFAPAIVADWGAYSCGCAILETADRLVSEEGEPSLRVYLLLLGATRALADGLREPALVLDAFLLRAMSHAGWAPSLSDCARCATPGPHRAFTVAGGGMVCPRCRPPGSVTPAAETVTLLEALLHGDWAVADASGDPTRREASGLVAAHLQWHLERQLRSLPLVDRRARSRPVRDPAVPQRPSEGAPATPNGPAGSVPVAGGPPVAQHATPADSTG